MDTASDTGVTVVFGESTVPGWLEVAESGLTLMRTAGGWGAALPGSPVWVALGKQPTRPAFRNVTGKRLG